MKAGWRNNYNDKTKWIEVIGKDLKFAFGDLKKWLSNGGKLPSILVYPDFPSKKTTIFKIANRLGYRITNKLISNPEVVLYFEDQTFGEHADYLRKRFPNALNLDCTDISKNKVDAIHLKVFGYNTIIDPKKYSGKAVQKSDINALHDGAIVDCPLDETKEGSIYQILLDNVFDDEYVVDFRVPVISGEIPLCYKKFKRMNVRFTNEVSRSEMVEVNSILSSDEQNSIIEFAKAMKVDFCELDILRHSDGRIFIIDVNKTPYGPPFGLQESDEAVSRLTSLFKKSFIEK
ncbi:MAG: hypothetical protein R2809_01300 [Flavobacteriales bacterium]